jgi:Fe-S cluster assembly protein SufB
MEDYELGFNSPTDNYSYKAKKGLSETIVREISRQKNEPKWMLELRLTALKQYENMPIPEWGANLNEINWEDIHYYLKPVDKAYQKWGDVPESVRKVFDTIGVPEAEKSMLAGVGSQFDSEVIYHSLQKVLAKKGMIFLSMDEGLKQYSEIVKEYFGKIVPYGDNKLAALNTAVWSGGSFVYIPRGIVVDLPLQAYFRINSENAGQFERTLIIAEKESSVSYVEGCSAPAFSSASLHAAVVEVIVKQGAKVRYSTVQNWYKTVYNRNEGAVAKVPEWSG